MDTQKFLNDIQSNDKDKRFAAWRAAGEVDPSVIAQLGKLAASNDPGIAKAAREALTTMTHSVGKASGTPRRAAVVKGLLEISGGGSTMPVRFHAFRLLSGVAGDDSVAAIAREIHNPDLREEAVYCLERIPGEASLRALIEAYPNAKDDFKPRILAALGHRRAGLTVVAAAMKSPDAAIRTAAMRAYGRIGQQTAAFPDETGLSEWQKLDRVDSMLRWAEAQVKEGNAAAAIPVYQSVMERTQEHWQCAGIVGLAKIGTAEAAAAILPKLKSTNRRVRITAQNAWKGMATA